MKRYLLAGLVAVALAMVVWGYSQIGGDDADSDDSRLGGGDTPVPSPSVAGMPGPPWDPPAATPTPTPGPTDAPESPEPPPAPASPAEAVAAPEPERAPEPPPQPAPPPVAEPAPTGGTLVHDVTLTIYSCLGDSTGAYCPGGQAMYSGQQVHRGAAACSWNWPIGQRLRIIGDPFNMVYTCLDRGLLGDVGWVDVWFYDYYAPETQAWRNAMDGSATVELLP